MPKIDFKAQAEALRDELVERRRDFHRHPELAFQEVRTAGIVARELQNLGLEVQAGVGRTGVIGLLEGAQDGPTVLVRADMDALPIIEENQTDYVSATPGIMHACGHDGHTAIALGVAKLFAQQRENLAGRIKFVFQPAEEIVGGAKAMIADGALDSPKPDVSLGLHLWNTMPLGVIGVADGPVMAAASVFTIIINGKGGHAASPHLANDPVVCAAQLILALQSIVSRNVNPFDTAVVSVTMMKASDADNIIPERVELQGTFRTFTLEVRDFVDRRIREISEAIATAMNCTVEVTTGHGVPPTINDPKVAARVREIFTPIVGADNLDMSSRTMGAEDMSLFMEKVPGMYFFVGSANEARGLNYGHHHPRFDFDEDALPLGVALLSAAVAEYVLPE
ncbi:MAG: amidohydrolase [bacterium]|nr:amidohydrolase [bacterium]